MQSIRQLRHDRGLTQFELALKIGVQPQSVYLWESGRRMPQVAQVRKLGQLFGVCSDSIHLESPSDFRQPHADLAPDMADSARDE